MNITYDEFRFGLKSRINDLSNWLRSIDCGYGDEINEDEFKDMKNNSLRELDCFLDKVEEDFGEYLD